MSIHRWMDKDVHIWRRRWHPTPVLLPGKSHGWRSLLGYSPWGCKESEMTEWLHFTHFTHFILYHWRREWQPTPVFLPGKSHGQRSLVGHSPWGRKKVDTTEWLHFTHFTHFILYHWKRKWQPSPVFLPGESHGQRSLAGHGSWGCRESDTTEVTEHALGNRTKLIVCCRWKSETCFPWASSWVELSLIFAFEKGDVPD